MNFLTEKFDMVKSCDLYLEYITLTNELGDYDEALKLLEEHYFHPFEGGEGKVAEQYKFSNVQKAKKLVDQKDFNKAIQCLEGQKNFLIIWVKEKFTVHRKLI